MKAASSTSSESDVDIKKTLKWDLAIHHLLLILGCPDGLLVKLIVFQALPNAYTGTGSNLAWANFPFVSKLFSLHIDARKGCLHVLCYTRCFEH